MEHMDDLASINFDTLEKNKKQLALFRKAVQKTKTEASLLNETISIKKGISIANRLKDISKIAGHTTLWKDIRALRVEKYIGEILNALFENSFKTRKEGYIAVAVVAILNTKNSTTADVFVDRTLKKMKTAERDAKETLLCVLCEMAFSGVLDEKTLLGHLKGEFEAQTHNTIVFLSENFYNELFEKGIPYGVSLEAKAELTSAAVLFLKGLKKYLGKIEKRLEESETQGSEDHRKLQGAREKIAISISLLWPHFGHNTSEVAKKQSLREWASEKERLFYTDLAIEQNGKKEEAKNLAELATKKEALAAADGFLAAPAPEKRLFSLATDIKEIPAKNLGAYSCFISAVLGHLPSVQQEITAELSSKLWAMLKRNPKIHFRRENFLQYISELIKFGAFPPKEVLPHLWYCAETKTLTTLAVLHGLLAGARGSLVNSPDTEAITEKIVCMLRLSKDCFEPHSEETMVVENILEMFTEKKKQETQTMTHIESFLLKILTVDIHCRKKHTVNILLKFPWSDPDVRSLLFRKFSQPWTLGGSSYTPLCTVLTEIQRHYPEFVLSVIDTVLEETWYNTTLSTSENKTALLANTEYIGDLCLEKLISPETVLNTLSRLLSRDTGPLHVRMCLALIDKTHSILLKNKATERKIKKTAEEILLLSQGDLPVELQHLIQKTCSKIAPDASRTAPKEKEKPKIQASKKEEDFETKYNDAVVQTARKKREHVPMKISLPVPTPPTIGLEKGDQFVLIRKSGKRKQKQIVIKNTLQNQ
ncbi:MAG: putative nonsense-mediated mRNA decay factor Upf2 [Amphiamblys sp. WSBS2006]|nr:MAG: putative nonsense-mediated mRNA decay factor Upf2 [Amphiamblys sp. WSBS2006]